MSWMALVLTLGATARLTRLIGVDTLTFPFRDWLAARTGDSKDKKRGKRFFAFVEDAVSCPWCLSIWTAAPVSTGAWFFGDTGWFIIPSLLLTASLVTGMVMTMGA